MNDDVERSFAKVATNAVDQTLERSNFLANQRGAFSDQAGELGRGVFGAVALGIYDRTLDRQLATTSASAEVKQLVQAARGQFVTAPGASATAGVDRQVAQAIIKASLAESIRNVMLLAAALALGAAASGALLPRSINGQTQT